MARAGAGQLAPAGLLQEGQRAIRGGREPVGVLLSVLPAVGAGPYLAGVEAGEEVPREPFRAETAAFRFPDL